MWWCSKCFSLELKLHISCFLLAAPKLTMGWEVMLSFVFCLFRGGWQQFVANCCTLEQQPCSFIQPPDALVIKPKTTYTISAVSASIGETSWPIFGAVAGVLFVSLEVVVRKKMKSLKSQISKQAWEWLRNRQSVKKRENKTKSKKLRTSEWLNDKPTTIICMFHDLQQTCIVMVLTSFFYPSIWTTGLHRQLPANGWRFKSVKT